MSLVLLRKALKEEKLIYGRDRVLKMLKNGGAKKVFVARGFNDTPLIEKYAGLAGVDVVVLDEKPIEVGLACKKQFPVSVLCY
tara:strand:- start:1826 stop:2074 length:249 start_codon:yes stop_codon:yes gene_type:complete